MSRAEPLVIIGAGIIGVCVAAYLAERGLAPLVIDRSGVVEETSSGNAAALAFSDILPLAQKGMLRNLPRWLADPLGPLAVPPAYLPRLTPWLWRFWRAGHGDQQTAVNAQAALMRLAEAEWLALMERSGTRRMLREDGSLELYESEAEFSASLPGWSVRERCGIAFEHVNRPGIDRLQPGLGAMFVRGTFVPGWKTVSDPEHLGKAIWAHAERHGARFEAATVEAVEPAGEASRLTLADGTEIVASRVVIAAGAWSHRFARRFGDRIPLETERGYNTTLPADAFDLKRQLIFSSHGFVVTPLQTGIRVGGAVELGGLERPPDYRRARAMLEKARRFMPGIRTQGGREWMGYRPSLPDSLPVIGRASGSQGVFHAFGHGHLGLTQAAATGRLIADLVSGNSPAIDPRPFRPDRFRGRI
ncbi:MAG: FAD-binding oxidoreductase [Rhizobiaceae bacterium]|nr:FAD-binding oxidoreductase [Rhizobiaceae bacterium]MCV0407336.1 FAD-binding oxidoreductase [Rhizobiaceae bacterium]